MTAISVAIDAAGRIVVPKPLREAAGLAAGSLLEIRLAEGGRLELVPLRPPRTIRRTKRWAVVADSPGAPPLAERDVEEVRARLRSGGR